MKTAEEILKSKLDGKITFVNNPDYTFNKVIEAMEEYRLQSHPSPMSASDMTAKEYFDGEGSPLTLSKICTDEEKEFLLQHIELYASGKVHQSKQPPMSAEQVGLGYYYPLFKFFADEHGLTLLDSQMQDVIHECKKFIEPSTPSVKADGWVSVEDIERLQSEIHKITGDGQVMMLFNKLLGNSAK